MSGPARAKARRRRTKRRSLIENPQAVIAAVLLVAVVLLGTVAIVRSYRGVTPTASSTAAAASPRDVFTDLFLGAWRKDQGKGSVSVEAVYYHPALRQALAQFDQKSLAQRELTGRLAAATARPAVPIVLFLSTQDPTAADAFDLSRHLTLSDERGQTHAVVSVDRLDPLNYQTVGIDRAYLVAFDGADEDQSALGALTLRLTDLDRVTVREFYWDLRNLTLTP